MTLTVFQGWLKKPSAINLRQRDLKAFAGRDFNPELSKAIDIGRNDFVPRQQHPGKITDLASAEVAKGTPRRRAMFAGTRGLRCNLKDEDHR
jgi:hypothetical protein